MTLKKIILAFSLVFCTQLQAQSVPFPQHVTYTVGSIKPNNFTQTELDNQVKTFYDAWKSTYLSQHCTDNTQYYIKYLPAETLRNSTSEGHGYGMMIIAYMAGYDANAKTYFDGLYKWAKLRDSNINPLMMEWRQGNNCSSQGESSASDGDIYIAYSLLLADKQWGSSGTINYKGDAINIINGIKQSEVNTTASTIKLGDWVDSGSSFLNTTRSSDFLASHFRSFKETTNDATWDNVTNKCYDIISSLQTNYSPTTGLLSDFVINVNTSTPDSPTNQVLESPNDGNYFYNACRDPWNLGVDYLVNGDARAKTAADKINTWLKTKTSNNINNIESGYKLDGTTLNQNYRHLAYIAPFAVGAMVNTSHQTWLNDLWTYIKNAPIGNNGNGYYGDIIKMQCMIIISGNYWMPQSGSLAVSQNVFLNDKFAIFPNPSPGSFNLNFTLKEATNAVLTITDSLGKTILSKNYTSLTAGENAISFDLKQVSKGVYFCQINAGKDKITREIIVE
jgi:endoglucanase